MLIGTLLVRDEEEIIAQNIEHHLSNGIDKLIITDNGSVDRTHQIIEKYPEVLEIINEPNLNFDQSKWVTRMAHLACDYGAEFVVHLDADEFWHGLKNVKNIIGNLFAIRSERGLDHLPVEGLKYNNFNIDQMPYYIKSMMVFQGSKVIHRASKEITIMLGNHSIKGSWPPIKEGIFIHHYPIRSYEQFEKKVVNGGSAYGRNITDSKECGYHWREWYEIWKKGELNSLYKMMLLSKNEIKEGLSNKTLFIDLKI